MQKKFIEFIDNKIKLEECDGVDDDVYTMYI
jgi:hypothetical protein